MKDFSGDWPNMEYMCLHYFIVRETLGAMDSAAAEKNISLGFKLMPQVNAR
jgi:hypothetical protein